MTVVAIVPAKDRADSVGTTVAALLRVPGVDQVLVVDDGSRDATTASARSAGARVMRLPENVGKGAAVAAGVAAAPDADVYLLIDADIADTAALADALLAPVVAGDADMTIAVLPPAAGRGGFGKVRDVARRGIRRASGFEAQAPLSGQRAVRGSLLRSLALAPRFGLETGLTIDAVGAGARVREVDVPMEHRHTGRSVAGFRHRGRQGADIVRALWPRVTTARQRLALIVGFFVLVAGVSLFESSRAFPTSVAGSQAKQVVIFGIPKLGWDDIGSGRMPALDGLVRRGAVAATSVRTLSGKPTTTEGYATLGAGARVKADEQGGYAFDDGESVEGGSAAGALHRRTGRPVDGEVAVVGAPATIRLNRNKHLPSEPGALGDALHEAGKRTAVVGNADTGYPLLPPSRSRPVGVALMDSHGVVDFGSVGSSLLLEDANAPFGKQADFVRLEQVFGRAADEADVILVDSGDLDRAAVFAAVSTPAQAARARRVMLERTDALLGFVAGRVAASGGLLLVVSVDPPGDDWHTTPMVAAGAGVRQGYLHSPSVRRLGVVTLTDVAPTVLHALDVDVPEGMIGHALRYHPVEGGAELGKLRRLDRDATFRERIYFPITLAYIIFQALVYLLAMVSFGRLGGVGRAGRVLRWIVLGVAAWPLATFVLRGIPGVAVLGGWSVWVLLAADAAIVALALRARRHALSPLQWILGATVALLVIDVAFGARLQTSSILGYSLHTAARFTGLGNTAFAVLAASAVLWGVIHLWAAPVDRRREALWTVAALFALVVLVDGAPTLGDDVGGILTLVPVFGITLLALSGRRIRLRTLAVIALVAVAVLAVATGIDVLRPAESRTHLGQLVTSMRNHGSGTFTTTVSRKFATNLRTYKSIWLWAIVIIAAYMVFFFAWARGWSRLLPQRSPLRVGVIAVLAAGLAGNFLNDSGAVVTALVFVFLGPFLTMIALHQERGEPVVFEAQQRELL
jgi:hypothetical protein